jgi:hypothetical protein
MFVNVFCASTFVFGGRSLCQIIVGSYREVEAHLDCSGQIVWDNFLIQLIHEILNQS